MTDGAPAPTARYRLELTEAEETLLARIDLTAHHGNHDKQRAAYLSNQEPILALLRSLRDRDGIPPHRVAWWSDPEYNPGRIKVSRKGIFERNGTRGAEIYIHPNFVRHLRYLLLGADLPDPVMRAFEELVEAPGYVSFGDALDIGMKARALVRRFGLDPQDAGDEFLKLALDLGVSPNAALRIRKLVREAR